LLWILINFCTAIFRVLIYTMHYF